MKTDHAHRDANPFATCFTRPDALACDGRAAARVWRRLQRLGGRGQVVGGHGTGKTTLLNAVAAYATSRGEPLRIVDGVERCGWWSQAVASRAGAAAGESVLIATHRVWPRPLGGPPVVLRTRPSASRLKRLFSRLTDGRETPVGFDDALRCFDRRRGDYRAVWFDLYDLHERRTRRVRTAAPGVTYRSQPLQRSTPDAAVPC